MVKCYSVDMAAKYMFAMDIDTFKQDQKKSEFGRLALQVGHVNFRNLNLFEFVPEFLRKWLRMNGFDIEPLDKLGDLFKRMIRERDPTLRYNDMVEKLQDQIRDGKLSMSEDDIIGHCMFCFFAGTDTSSNALVRVFHYLVAETEVRERLQGELRSVFKQGITYQELVEHPYLDAFVSECLRLGQSLLSLDR